MRELKDAGLVQTNVELLQLAFNSHDDWTRKEFVETGAWLNLQTGTLQLTRNYRPYHAAKYIREDDSCAEPRALRSIPQLTGAFGRPLSLDISKFTESVNGWYSKP